jgi:hypothetical protein
MNKIFVRILGLVSIETLQILNAEFPVFPLLKYEKFLFIDYSEFDIPVGYEFKFMIRKTETPFPCSAQIKMVTQAWGKEFKEGIPSGHKTIVRFLFDFDSVKLINLMIPVVDSWQILEPQILFSNDPNC